MSYEYSKSIQSPVQSEQEAGDRSPIEAMKPTQADQQLLEEAYELRDDQLESFVGGLSRLRVIRVIGFEN